MRRNGYRWVWGLVVSCLALGITHAKSAHSPANPSMCGSKSVQGGAQAMDLNSAIEQVVCQTAGKRLVVIGENHGSKEIPAFVAALVKATGASRPIRVGLEWPAWMHDYVAAYLASKGTLNDREALLRMGYWKWPDGRSSVAMIDLLDSIRVLRQQGRDIQVFLMEPNVPTDPEALKASPLIIKENGMTKALRAAVEEAPSKALVIALMGNFHSSYKKRENPPQPSVLQRVVDQHPLYVLVTTAEGTIWNCAETCGVHPLGAAVTSVKTLPNSVTMEALRDAPAGITAERLSFARFTASMPAPRPDSPATPSAQH